MANRKIRAFSLPPELDEELEKYVNRRGQTLSRVVCDALRKHIAPKKRKALKQRKEENLCLVLN